MLDINVKNERLYDALLSLTKLTLDIVSRRIKSELVVSTESVWEKQSPDTYIKRQAQKPLWAIILHKANKEIIATQQYTDLISILKSDETISPQLDTLVGTCLDARRLEANNIATWPVYEFFTDQGITPFSFSTFNKIYSEIEKALYTDEIEYESITPLCGYSSDETNISLDGNISIVKLSENEIIEILRLGINLGTSMGNMDFIHGIHQYALKIKYRFKKIVGEKNRDSNEVENNPYINGAYATAIVDALRIFKEGKLYPITTIRRSKSILSTGTSFSFENPVRHFMEKKYVLTKNESNEFRSFWSAQKETELSDKNFLSVGIRRFSQSNERNNIEDRIIDIMIAAESIFLSSGGSFQGELKYRLSHRAAMFIENDVKKQRYVFDFMQKAYDVRSSIVHGSAPKLPKKMDDSEYTLEEFCNDIEKYLRISIKKIMNQVIRVEDKTNIIDWKSVIFPELN